MAMFKCPECGNEVSDKTKKCPNCGKLLIEEPKKFCPECGKEIDINAIECPHCGCPIEDEKSAVVGKPKKDLKKVIIPVVALIAVIIIGVVIYNIKIVKPKNTYNKAMELLEIGEYEEANELFETISNYEDVAEIQEQLKYESYAYSAINSLKQYLKNPDSFQPYEILFYASMGGGDDSSSTEEQEDTGTAAEDEETYPVCIMHYGAQNGFGGNTTNYAVFTYDSDAGEYAILGSCDSLDEDEYDADDEDDMYDLIICKVINLYRDGDDTVGSIDLNRLKTVLKNDAYTTIKIIE